MATDKLPELLSVKQVAVMMKCSESHVRNLINRGVLDHYLNGGKIQIGDDDVAAYLATCKSIKPIRKAERRPLFRRPPPPDLDHLS